MSEEEGANADVMGAGADTSGAEDVVWPAIRDDLYCPKCSYNLRGLTGDRCPECGYSLEDVRSGVSLIPWVHRRQIGRFRAYWKTIWMVMMQPKRLALEIGRPVSYPDSQSFRWVTVLHVYLPVLLGAILLYIVEPTRPFHDKFLDEAYRAIWPMVLLHFLVILYVIAATGVPSYFFHPRGVAVNLQNRAVALSYYGGGWLAPTTMLLLLVEVCVLFFPNELLGIPAALLLMIMAALFFIGWPSLLIDIGRRALGRGWPWRLKAGVGMWALWLVLFVFVFILVPTAVPFLWIVVSSFS
ncbi:MAG: hypothetical protein JSU63_20295 [Phycisphaerales bacterium]|nr:MAG: hypothetical protein JSU63_20295 [Phycisphaerales bacterium]